MQPETTPVDEDDLAVEEIHLQRVLDDLVVGERLFQLEMFQRAVFALWRQTPHEIH